MHAVDPVVPRWVVPASLALAVVGFGLSLYLAVEHLTAQSTLACPATGAVNCARVTTSDQATLFGVPVAFLGLAFFLAMVAACLPGSWRRTTPAVRRGRVALAVAGVGFVVYLIFAELFLLDAVCLWCTAVHVVAFGLFGVVALATALIEP